MNKSKHTLKEDFFTAVQNYREKNFKKAEIICYKILGIDPHHFDSTSLLASICAVNQDYKKAKNLLLKAIDLQPKNVTILNNLGTACKELGEFNESIKFYEKTIKIHPKHVNAHYNLGVVYYNLKDLRKSKIYFQKTVEMQNNFAFAFFSLGNVHVDLKEFENAVSCYQKAIEINPNLLGAYNNLGLVFRTLNDFKNAINCYENTIKIKPNHVGAHHNLAEAYKDLGEFEKAIKSRETAIKYEPDNILHYYYLSELKKGVLDSSLKSKIKKILSNDNSLKISKAYGNYLLSKYEKKQKNYEKEMNYLIKGHQDFYESKKEKFSLGIKYCFEDIMQIVEGAQIEKTNMDKNEVNPIFIVGVPRSGSTLVEKIIGSGQRFIPIGEETSVLENYINKRILEKESLNLGEAASIRKELFGIYKNMGLISKKYNYVFTDKSLNNFFYLNLIKEIYPDCKVINCKRDVTSSIMSIFQNNLTELAWAHNLENIFKYFDNYFKIIKDFEKVHPNWIYNLDFEKLINNPEEQSKKLMKFCALPWDEKCLEFYKRKDLISKTTSNVQIRKAIYKNSSVKYEPYKKFLNKYGKKYSWFN